jgi:GDP-L-fucose synthase
MNLITSIYFKMDRILVTGGTGQVGKELKKILPNAVFVGSKDYDLTNCKAVSQMYKDIKPTTVIHSAAKVGGILDNIQHQVEYYAENVMMNTLVVDQALKNNVKNFIGILSTCAYPDIVDQYPMEEIMLHNGKPTITNFSYGIAKRGMAVHIDAIREKYSFNYCYLIPCNLYGPYDKFDYRSHYVGALVSKIHEAKLKGKKKITLYGDGTPLRQFLYAKDLAVIISSMIEQDLYENLNIASEANISIDSIARIALDVLECSDFTIIYDNTKPNGQHRKDVCLNKFKKYFPDFLFTPLQDGIKNVYNSINQKVL